MAAHDLVDAEAGERLARRAENTGASGRGRRVRRRRAASSSSSAVWRHSGQVRHLSPLPCRRTSGVLAEVEVLDRRSATSCARAPVL